MPSKDSAMLPLNLVADYTKKYPGIWNAVQLLRDAPNLIWDKNRCYLPIAGGIAVADYFKMPNDAVFVVPAIAAWRQSKEVYTFDPDLAETLYDQADDTKIPCDILMQLPFFCVYIDSGKYRFFSHLENDQNDGRWELRFARIMSNGKFSRGYLHLGDFTLSESIAAGIDEAMRQMERAETDDEFKSYLEQSGRQESDCESDVLNQTVLGEMLQLVLYICADNADVRQSDDNQRTYRKPKSDSDVKDKYREVRKWDTGFYVGSSLRNARSQSGSHDGSGGTTGRKRPHMRRGHWHHFWRGSQGNRELVLHWVLPIMVNDDGEEPPARITPVK